MRKQLLTAVCALFLTVGAANAQIVIRIGPPRLAPRPLALNLFVILSAAQNLRISFV